ncbi:ATP-binding protein [Nitriliruptor alkaliphilus]|uniref:ATP-binding protein n=1 Tax=Nitriliruptor alkaliphilus TaxID=427918 RepID=UPI0009F9233C
MELLERDEQLAVLDAAREEAAAGRGCVVLVEGEPGIGKTALVTRLMHSGSGHPVAVLQRAAEPTTAVPGFWRPGTATGTGCFASVGDSCWRPAARNRHATPGAATMRRSPLGWRRARRCVLRHARSQKLGWRSSGSGRAERVVPAVVTVVWAGALFSVASDRWSAWRSGSPVGRARMVGGPQTGRAGPAVRRGGAGGGGRNGRRCAPPAPTSPCGAPADGARHRSDAGRRAPGGPGNHPSVAPSATASHPAAAVSRRPSRRRSAVEGRWAHDHRTARAGVGGP